MVTRTEVSVSGLEKTSHFLVSRARVKFTTLPFPNMLAPSISGKANRETS